MKWQAAGKSWVWTRLPQHPLFSICISRPPLHSPPGTLVARQMQENSARLSEGGCAMGFLSDAYLAGILNLASSILVFLPAVIIIWCYRVKQFEEHPYLSCSFVLWALQWFALIVVWALYSPLRFHHVVGVLPRVQSVGVLAAADLSVVAAMGFYWVYAKAEEFRWQEAVRNLVGLYAFLFFWNVLFSPLAPNERLNWLWILPSEILSIITTGLIAATFWFRFGASALPLSGTNPRVIPRRNNVNQTFIIIHVDSGISAKFYN